MILLLFTIALVLSRWLTARAKFSAFFSKSSAIGNCAYMNNVPNKKYNYVWLYHVMRKAA